MLILTKDFFEQDTKIVAEKLLGKLLIRKLDNNIILKSIICETEAYLGFQDSACHSFRGKTPRNVIMFGSAGFAYVYFIYGMHYMLNIVTEKENSPCAVLFRAILPIDGIEYMQKLRGLDSKNNKNLKNLANGPAKICQALNINKTLNGCDFTKKENIWIEDYQDFNNKIIYKSPRIGINYAEKKDKEALLRFWISPNK